MPDQSFHFCFPPSKDEGHVSSTRHFINIFTPLLADKCTYFINNLITKPDVFETYFTHNLMGLNMLKLFNLFAYTANEVTTPS